MLGLPKPKAPEDGAPKPNAFGVGCVALPKAGVLVEPTADVAPKTLVEGVEFDPKAPVDVGPKAPVDDDPKAPVDVAPKAPVDDDPKAPVEGAGFDPKAPVEGVDDDPKAPVDGAAVAPNEKGEEVVAVPFVGALFDAPVPNENVVLGCESLFTGVTGAADAPGAPKENADFELSAA